MVEVRHGPLGVACRGRQGTLGVDGRGWVPAENTVDRVVAVGRGQQGQQGREG